ncbi:MAG: hypothetical protein HRF48_02085, partial [Chloroflexota bacterium]
MRGFAVIRPSGVGRYALAALLLAALGAFLVWPIVLTVRSGFVTPEGRFTLRYLLSIFHDPVLMQG